MRQAFNQLRGYNKWKNNQNKRLKDILGTLFDTQESKKGRAFNRLMKNNIMSGASGEMNGLRSKLQKIIEENRAR